MLRAQFDEELEKLHNQFYAMGTEVLAQMNKSIRAFVSHDKDLATEVIEEDAEINNFEVKLEKKSLEIIALQQPVSQDLRTVITVLKASSDLERVGDHSVSVAKAAIRMKGGERSKSVEEAINKMGHDVKLMLDQALNAYIEGDDKKALEIAKLDDNINKQFIDIQERTIRSIQKNTDKVVAGKDYFQVIIFLERMGDYAKNICEWVVYLKTGKIIEL